MSNMDTEDYVSYDAAKMLKESKYDESISCFYSKNKKFFDGLIGVSNKDRTFGYCSAPSLYEAQKWLRKKELEVSANFDTRKQKWFSFVMRFDSIESLPEWMSDSIYDTYEKALDDGIKEALKNI